MFSRTKNECNIRRKNFNKYRIFAIFVDTFGDDTLKVLNEFAISLMIFNLFISRIMRNIFVLKNHFTFNSFVSKKSFTDLRNAAKTQRYRSYAL